MSKKRILLQLDSGAHASVFDAVVAVDADVDHLLQYNGVAPDAVRELVHGAIFTRGVDDLNSTAIFVGGANVEAAEVLLQSVKDAFFGPMRVSVMLDANGANTTAAAAVLAAARHVALPGAVATVLAGTGPVGQRAARLLAQAGARVRLCSRNVERAAAACQRIQAQNPVAQISPAAASQPEEVAAALDGAGIVIAAGAAGIELLPHDVLQAAVALQVVIDLNAVPPLGIAGVEVQDKAKQRGSVICYGAIGVGGAKMKIHKQAIAHLFLSNDQILDAEEIFEIGRELEK